MKTIKENLTSISKNLGVIILLLTAVNFTQNDMFSEWDQNGDDELAESEFQEGFLNDHYSDWDTDNNGNISSEEFYTSTFDVIDEDGNKEINTAEKEWGFEHLYGDYVEYNVTVESEEDTTAIDYQGYKDSVKDTEFYSGYDSDGDSNLNDSELSKVVFKSLDENEDGTLSSSEFNSFQRYFLDENKNFESERQ